MGDNKLVTVVFHSDRRTVSGWKRCARMVAAYYVARDVNRVMVFEDRDEARRYLRKHGYELR